MKREKNAWKGEYREGKLCEIAKCARIPFEMGFWVRDSSSGTIIFTIIFTRVLLALLWRHYNHLRNRHRLWNDDSANLNCYCMLAEFFSWKQMISSKKWTWKKEFEFISIVLNFQYLRAVYTLLVKYPNKRINIHYVAMPHNLHQISIRRLHDPQYFPIGLFCTSAR